MYEFYNKYNNDSNNDARQCRWWWWLEQLLNTFNNNWKLTEHGI